MKKKKDKTLTTRFDSETWAEFTAAVEILGFRSINALVHQIVMLKIREAKNAVTAEEFQAVVGEQKKQTQKRSKLKSKERLEMLGELVSDRTGNKKAA